MTSSTERAWRMPGEFEPHDGCLMVWPTRLDLWNGRFDAAKCEYTETAAAIAAFEPVTMIAAPGQAAEARAMLPAAVEVIELPVDDSWFHDSGPIFTLDGRMVVHVVARASTSSSTRGARSSRPGTRMR